jgi:c(7)-type cytochrome triheme protein
MKYFVALMIALSMVLSMGVVTAADKGPEKIVFKSKMGNVTFDHAKHQEREKGDCKVCHPKLFPQSKAPINFGKGMHKPAEAAKTSCAGCHVAGGQAFATKGNCNKCHVKGS